MQIDAQYISQLRKAKGWSQEQLAEIADLGLRTVQRVESEGQCSLETRNALGSAFGVAGPELEMGPDKDDIKRHIKLLATTIRMTFLVCILWGWGYFYHSYHNGQLERWEFWLLFALMPILCLPAAYLGGLFIRHLRRKHGVPREKGSMWFSPIVVPKD